MTRADTEAAIRAAEAEIERLAAQHDAAQQRLRELRQAADPTAKPSEHSASTLLTPHRKIELFRSLFRGRDDVFAVRWESRKGRAGYSPKCANEWRPGVCEKPRVRCAACPHQAFAPADDRAVRDHLQGRIVMGLYPLLEDDTCHLLAIDLDGESWSADVGALRDICTEVGLTPAPAHPRGSATTSSRCRSSEPPVRALNALDRLPADHATALLFPSPSGAHLDLHNFRVRDWKPAQRHAGIDPVRRVYDLRHTFATMALRAGVSTFDLSRYMGASLTMIDRHYGHLARDGREHVIRLLDAHAQEARTATVDAGGRQVDADAAERLSHLSSQTRR
jgi:hypothetical protein